MWSWKSFDFFQKADSEARIATASGGLVTIITSALIFLLVANETIDYLSVLRRESIGVDRSFGEKMNINVDITFPSSACRLVHFDVVDSTGEEQLAIEDLTKTSIPNKAAKLGEGCRVKGELHVNKLAGNFHFALGKGVPNTAVGEAMSTDPFASTMIGAQHQHRFDMFELQMFNASHRIKRLSIGKEYPGMLVQPLDGTEKMVESGMGQYNYYLSVVPTVYTKVNGHVIKSAQYTYTQKIVEVHSTATRFPHPGTFFFLSISPLVVKITEQHKSFMHYFTSVCALAGSVWVVSSFLDAAISFVFLKLGIGETNQRLAPSPASIPLHRLPSDANGSSNVHTNSTQRKTPTHSD